MLWGEIPTERSIPQVEIPEPTPSDFIQPRMKAGPSASTRTRPAAEKSRLCYPLNKRGENLCLHNVEMISHIRLMRNIVAQAQSKQKLLKAERVGAADNLLLPKRCPNPPHRFFKGKLPRGEFLHLGMRRDDEDDGDAGGEARDLQREVDPSSVRKLMKKGVEATVAHAGYDTAHDSCIEILTDVLGDNLTKMCQLLGACRDDERLHGSSGYPDCMEKMLRAIGLDGVEALQKFWNESVWEFGIRLEKTAESLERAFYVAKNACREMKQEGKLPDESAATDSEVDPTSPGVAFTSHSDSDVSTPGSFLCSPSVGKSKKSKAKGGQGKTKRPKSSTTSSSSSSKR